MESNGNKHLYKVYATPVEVLKEKGELVGLFRRIIGGQGKLYFEKQGYWLYAFETVTGRTENLFVS